METHSLPEVHWGEGMLLLPQHFQALGAHLTARLDAHVRRSGVSPFGVRVLDLEVTGGNVRIARADVVLPSGRRLIVPGNTVVEPRALEGAHLKDGLVVHLGLPMPRPGVSAIWGRENPLGRYVLQSRREEDENGEAAGADVLVRFNRAQLLLGDAELDGFDSIPLARVVRASPHDPEFRLDVAFVPPLLDLRAVPGLDSRLQELCGMLRERNEALGRDLEHKPFVQAGQAAKNLEPILKLFASNAQLAEIEQLVSAEGVHPFAIYLSLCRLVGALAVFRTERRAPKLPAYDHLRLGPCFDRVIAHAREFIDCVWQRPWDVRPFAQEEGERFQVCELPESWRTPKAQLFLAVEAPGLSDTQLRKLMVDQIKLVGEQDVSEGRWKKAVRGVRCGERVDDTRLPSEPGRFFFPIDPTGSVPDRWKAFLASERACLFSDAVDLSPYSFALYVIGLD